METKSIKFKDEEIEVEIADNILKRAWGLSFRKNGKMLFKFSRKTRAKIDMALLSKKLYLYFISDEREVISIQEADPWSWNPKTWKLYAPKEKYKYLLESFEELNLEKGDEIHFIY